MAERAGDQQWKRSFLLHTSFTAVERGDWDEALRLTHEAEESPGAETDVFARGILLTRVVILARRGALVDAREAIATSGFDESDSDEQNRAQLWLARSELLAGESRFAEAAAIARRGADGFATLGLGHPAVKAAFILESWCEFHAGDRQAATAASSGWRICRPREPHHACSPTDRSCVRCSRRATARRPCSPRPSTPPADPRVPGSSP
jgi:ATP/maltotriose-dependent transcriptional regulator MalT